MNTSKLQVYLTCVLDLCARPQTFFRRIFYTFIPGHGYVVADSHLDLPVDHRSRDELYDDLLPYGRLIRQGVDGVMIAHVRYPQIDSEVASLSPYWLRTVLRSELDFAGVIFSDDLSMQALVSEGGMAERARD